MSPALHTDFYMPLFHARNGQKIFQQMESSVLAIIQTFKCPSHCIMTFLFTHCQHKLWLFKGKQHLLIRMKGGASRYLSGCQAQTEICSQPSVDGPPSSAASLSMVLPSSAGIAFASSMGTVQIQNGNLFLSHLETIFSYC